MTNAASSIVVFRNQAGDYFLLSQATLEQGRVPEERKAEVERLVAETEGFKVMEGDEVQGYAAVGNYYPLDWAGEVTVILPPRSPGGIAGAVLDAWNSIPR